MAKIAYQKKKFGVESLQRIMVASNIIHEYAAKHYNLTLRQLYYQFVARGFVENTERSYKNLGNLINDARLCGYLDWEAIEDRTRNVRSRQHWTNPAEVINAARHSYHIDMWANQVYRPEVWIEKDALLNAVERVCSRLDVPYMACRGYTSQSEEWRAGMRFARQIKNGQRPVVIYLGDHDPSGIDMTRDHRDRLKLLTGGSSVEVIRIALNMDQINKFNPPPNPAKLTDSRAIDYIRKFGMTSWELDALSPDTIGAMVEKQIVGLRDELAWEEREEELEDGRRKLEKALAGL